MINDKNQTIDSGNDSTNYQAGHDVTVKNGLSITEALQIADFLFKENFIKLQDIAREVALSRANEITEKFLSKLIENNPTLLDSFCKAPLIDTSSDYSFRVEFL